MSSALSIVQLPLNDALAGENAHLHVSYAGTVYDFVLANTDGFTPDELGAAIVTRLNGTVPGVVCVLQPGGKALTIVGITNVIMSSLIVSYAVNGAQTNGVTLVDNVMVSVPAERVLVPSGSSVTRDVGVACVAALVGATASWMLSPRITPNG